MFAVDYDLNASKVSSGQGNFFKPSKIEDGDSVTLRCLGIMVTGYTYWTNDNQCKRLTELPKDPKDIRVDDAGKKDRVRHFWAFPVWNSTEGSIQLAEVTQAGIQEAVFALYQDKDWGDLTTYPLKIRRTGQGLKTEYSVNPSPKAPMPAEAIAEWDKVRMHFDLSLLFSGGNPFEGSVSAPAIGQPQDAAPSPDKPTAIRRLFAAAKSCSVAQLGDKGKETGLLESKEKLKAFMGIESIKDLAVPSIIEWAEYFSQLSKTVVAGQAEYDEIPF